MNILAKKGSRVEQNKEKFTTKNRKAMEGGCALGDDFNSVILLLDYHHGSQKREKVGW